MVGIRDTAIGGGATGLALSTHPPIVSGKLMRNA